jgi:CO dehydrogenase maturation factor
VPNGLKIAIGGKGGVGKTTVCAVWSRLFAEDGFNVMAIDADPNTTLASAFGIPPQDSPRPLIEMKQLITERTGTTKDSIGLYFKMNPKVSDLPDKYSLKVNGLKLLVLGAITQAGAGCACAEGVFLKAMLTNTILQRQEVVIVDLPAGPEFLGRASIQGIDAFVIVVEPGGRSIETAVNMARMGKELGIRQLAVITNKITDDSQIKIIASQLGNLPVIANIKYDPAIQQTDLQRKNVFQENTTLVKDLRQAKAGLTELIKPSGV